MSWDGIYDTVDDEVRSTRRARTFWALAIALIIVAQAALPTPLFWIFIGLSTVIGSVVAGARWKELLIQTEADLIEATANANKQTADAVELAYDLDRALLRLGEVLDENTMLRDLHALKTDGITDDQFEAIRVLFDDDTAARS